MIKFENNTLLEYLCITFDTDWVPEFILEELLSTLLKNNLKATIFATNSSEVLNRYINSEMIEIALHPNFFANSSHGNNINEVLESMIGMYPTAIGMRSHGLYQSSPLLRQLENYGIKYDCNLMLDDHANLKPFKTFYNVLRIPYNWSDASHLLKGKECEVDEIQLNKPGLKILDFHPILWYLNSSNYESYNKLKLEAPRLLEANKILIDKYVESGKGIKYLFENLIHFINNEIIDTYTLRELYNDFE